MFYVKVSYLNFMGPVYKTGDPFKICLPYPLKYQFPAWLKA